MLKKGDVLDDRYLIDSTIGYGDTSTVFRAYDLKADNADRAVKEFSGSEEEICRMIEESILMSELYSSSTKFNNIPNIIHRVKNENTLYIVMEYINGWNMGSVLKSQNISYRKIIDYAMDICTFISLLHQKNKIYCNMKPENIMILKNDDSSEIIKTSKHFSNLKFIDFGSVINKGEYTSGYTPEYAAPEQYLSSIDRAIPDERTDIFNIGASLYHMATGKMPLPVFYDEDKSSEKVRPSCERFIFSNQDIVNSGLKRIILRCVNDDPKLRFQSCSSLCKELINLSEHRHMKRTFIMLSVSLILAGGGFFTARQYKIQSQNEFEYYMDIAKKSSSPQEKIENYRIAIDLEPENQEAYVELINACSYSKYDNNQQDTLFTSAEKTIVLQVIHKNRQLLITEKKYEKVVFELGKLIWYHEDYGLNDNTDNKTTRMRDASQYFGEAISTENGKTLSKENLEMARTYYNIGKFYDDIIKGSSINNAQLYINFWNDLHSMINFVIESNSKNDLVRLETYRTALDALDSYSAYFKDCGYNYDSQIEFFKLIHDKTEECNPDKNTKEIYNLKQNIQDRYDQCLTSIKMSFSSDVNRIEVTE